MSYILEIGSNVLPDLHKLDELYKQFKAYKTESELLIIINKLEIQLENIFGTVFKIYPDFKGELADNFAVIPSMKKNGKIETGDDFVKLGQVKKLTLIIGMKLAKSTTPRGLTAITLHEIGHVAGHISKFIIHLSDVTRNMILFLKVISMIPAVGLVLLPVSIITSRTLSWTEHVSEYEADKFAAKYGYGDELAKVAKILISKENKVKTEASKTISGKLYLVISKIFSFVFGTTHPESKSRIEKLVETMKTEYNGKYNNRILQKILDNY